MKPEPANQETVGRASSRADSAVLRRMENRIYHSGLRKRRLPGMDWKQNISARRRLGGMIAAQMPECRSVGEVAALLGISQSRVKQIAAEALCKVALRLNPDLKLA